MVFIFSTTVLIKHLWRLKTVVFLHWCLIHADLIDELTPIEAKKTDLKCLELFKFLDDCLIKFRNVDTLQNKFGSKIRVKLEYFLGEISPLFSSMKNVTRVKDHLHM
jgi:hypothetical protein